MASILCCSRMAGHLAVTFASVGVVVALLIVATAMQWTTTAQLLCNTPTMIVEVCNPPFPVSAFHHPASWSPLE